MFKCKMCDKLTEAIVNINFKAVSLCDPCASSIAVQQVQWWATECTPKAKELVPTPNNASAPLCPHCKKQAAWSKVWGWYCNDCGWWTKQRT